MAEPEKRHDWLPPRVRSALEEAESRLLTTGMYELAWDVAFTPAERQKLGGDVDACRERRPNLIAMYMNVRAVSQYRATVELADRLKVLSLDRDYLLQALGEAVGEQDEQGGSSTAHAPLWDKSSFKLTLAGDVIRQIKKPKAAKNIILILDAFQEDGWPDHIDDPLPGGADPARLADAVKSLNDGLQRIKFGKDGSGQGVVWRFR